MAAGQHCLSMSGHTHKQRNTHTFAWHGAILTLLSVLVFFCVRVRVCIRDQMGVRPIASVPCQHQQPLCTMASSLCSIRAPCLALPAGRTLRHTAPCSRTRPCCSVPLTFDAASDQTRELHTTLLRSPHERWPFTPPPPPIVSPTQL